jgi:diguanylate cyclase (GGDEF)-like protein
MGWPQLVALAALAVLLAGVMWRRGARILGGVPAGYREQVELGALVVITAAALVQATGGGALEPPLQPVLYLVMAFLVAFLAWPVGLAMVLLAVALEFGPWWQRGADPATLAVPLAHAGFLALFSLLYRGVLAANVQAGQRAGQKAVARRLGEIEERAQAFQHFSTAPGDQADAAERSRRLTEAVVHAAEEAVQGDLEVVATALHTDTCAVFLLSDDGQWLKRLDCRSSSDAIAERVPAGEGALGGAVKLGRPVRLHGEVRAASYHLDGRRPGALLVAPLVDRRGGHVRGVVVADRYADRPFDDDQEQLLVKVAGEMVTALASAKKMTDLTQGGEEKARLVEAIQELNRSTTLGQVADALLEAAASTVEDLAFSAVTRLEHVEGAPRHSVFRARGPDPARPLALEGLAFGGPKALSLVMQAVEWKTALPAPGGDVEGAEIFDEATRLKGLRSLRVVPLLAQGLRDEDRQAVGALVLGSPHADAFRDLELQLELFANQAAESIQRARLFEKTERLATTDGLTGLLNHRTFQERLDEQLLAVQRYGRKVSLLLCDIDHFKSVNDTYGHPVGDQVLRGVARVLLREARTTDLVARYGGEEFAVVMPETDQAGALVIAERIRERIGQLVTQTAQGPLKVTMSLGIATIPGDGAGKADLVEKADACLYFAKRHGRNQCVTAARLKGGARAPG